jgi:hypothetical protein
VVGSVTGGGVGGVGSEGGVSRGGVEAGVGSLRDNVGEVTVADNIVGGEVARGAVKTAEGRRLVVPVGGGEVWLAV